MANRPNATHTPPNDEVYESASNLFFREIRNPLHESDYGTSATVAGVTVTMLGDDHYQILDGSIDFVTTYPLMRRYVISSIVATIDEDEVGVLVDDSAGNLSPARVAEKLNHYLIGIGGAAVEFTSDEMNDPAAACEIVDEVIEAINDRRREVYPASTLSCKFHPDYPGVIVVA